MKLAPAILTTAIAISLAGCVLRGKPAAVSTLPVTPRPAEVAAPPPAPPAALSSPQTHPELPAPQPLSAEALATTELPGEPPPPLPPPPRVSKKGNASPPRPRPEAAPATPPPATPAATPAELDPRPPIQEIVSPEDSSRLKASADTHKSEIRRLFGQLPWRELTKEQRDVVDTIRSFVRLSDEAEQGGDMRKANELAERGLVLAQGLPGAR